MAITDEFLARIRGLPFGGPGLDPSVMTPGFNPSGSLPSTQPNQPKGTLGKLDGFLNSQGGGLLMNLLAQSGYSTMPQSPFGAIGRATLANQEQQTQKARGSLEDEFLRSQIGLNQAKTAAEGVGDLSSPKSAIAKINFDERSGLITPEQAENQRAKVLREGQTNVLADVNSLRGQYRTDIAGPRASLSGLAAAEGLLSVNNAIGDTAAFTSFIRSIDNSVVRPAEQDAYNKALGIRNQIQATVQQWAGKGPLPPDTKRALLASIRELRDTMEGIVDRTTAYYGGEATKSGLDVESVTGLPVKFDQREVDIPDDNGGGDTGDVPPITQAAIDFGVTPEIWAKMPPAARRDFED